MAEKKHLITKHNFGAWVLKCNPKVWDLGQFLEMGGEIIDGWSLGNTYRNSLMEPGQPVVFWVSGPLEGEHIFRGIWGFGKLTSTAQPSDGQSEEEALQSLWFDQQKAMEPGFYVDTRIPILVDPIPATEFLNDPVLRTSEVIRAQQMPNPAFLTKAEYKAALRLRGLTHSDTDEEGPAIVSNRGAGFGTAAQNRKVEVAAMKAAAAHYNNAGFETRDVSARNFGWDMTALHRTIEGQIKHVEVKGVSGSEPKVLLTRNEYETAQVDPDWELAVVTNALTKPTITIYSARQLKKVAEPFAWRAHLSQTSTRRKSSR